MPRPDVPAIGYRPLPKPPIVPKGNRPPPGTKIPAEGGGDDKEAEKRPPQDYLDMMELIKDMPDVPTEERNGHTLYKIGPQNYYSPGEGYDAKKEAKILKTLYDRYTDQMNVVTPRTAARNKAAAEAKAAKEKADADARSNAKYDPLYDWSLYARKDHPKWLRYKREKALQRYCDECGQIPEGTLDFSGADVYGKNDPFLFNSYRPEEYEEFFSRFPEVYKVCEPPTAPSAATGAPAPPLDAAATGAPHEAPAPAADDSAAPARAAAPAAAADEWSAAAGEAPAPAARPRTPGVPEETPPDLNTLDLEDGLD